MQGLIQKSGYIEPGCGAGNYAEYIATRDGVELLNRSGQYMKYIAERPRSHGLFSNTECADLEKTMEEVSNHPAPVWTFIYSLRREDAVRLGYNSAESWRKLLLAHQTKLANAMKIPPSQFRWCAAFHDEKHHPHIHMMVWSADPKQGYLTEQGIEKMRSKLTNDIFQDELLHLYKQKELSYQDVRDTAHEAMGQLIRNMESGIYDCPVVEDKLVALSKMLQDTNGKKVYGYLKKSIKAQVDAIVDELAQLPAVAECYEAWNKLRDDVEGYYADSPRERLPLSQQKEFKAIKNLVIREAERIRLGKISFEDEQMDDEQNDEDEVLARQANWQMVNMYRKAKYVLCDDDSTWAEQEEAVHTLEQLWNDGFTAAAHQLGKCWRDGLGVLPDDDKAELWFRRSAETGNDFSQYALGRLLQNRKRIKEAVGWYEKAAAQGNQFADCRLGKLYLLGDGVPKDTEKAIVHLTQSAKTGNRYAQYTLGKLYLDRQDCEQAHYWFSQSAAQGNEYAQFFLDRWDSLKPPTVMLSVTRLLHHLSEIFRDNSVPPQAPAGQQADRKLRLKIREKKIAMGHKADDHEEQLQGQTMTMG
ncbi:MAG: sel1 repeat family protein [Oscillibacter sp.]|jgi:TPR repeat protein|nr:sel1 repeat family protein [Oscillibacter sp.]